MDKNHSPWISELNLLRQAYATILKNLYDVAIVGGGISGMVSAYYTLKHTKHSVVLLEATRLANGATGHNAGQVVDYFEKPFSEIAEEYGLTMAIEGQKAVNSAWELVDEILKETEIKIPFARFTGYAGCTTKAQLFMHLENKSQKHTGGLSVVPAMLAQELFTKEEIDEKYHQFCRFVTHAEILGHLETTNKTYIAALQSKKGTMNSALFVEKLSEYLLQTYPDRFTIREHSPVSEIQLNKDAVILKTNQQQVTASRVVLCTNGFEDFTIVNNDGPPVNHLFHDYVKGIIGYMAGYLEKTVLPPKAISYFPNVATSTGDEPYFYVTRRNHMWEEIEKSLVCIGGPEEIHEEVLGYSTHFPYSKKAFGEIDLFLKETYQESTHEGIDYVFKWHGLMGYTKSGIRSIGHEPANSRLLYNLGCNGVGILPSIYGGYKISKHLAGEEVPLSIFDPIIQKTVVLQRA